MVKLMDRKHHLPKDEEFLLAVKRILNENMVNTDFSITTLHEELGMSRTVLLQ
jgi:hypothetical protein